MNADQATRKSIAVNTGLDALEGGDGQTGNAGRQWQQGASRQPCSLPIMPLAQHAEGMIVDGHYR